MIYDDQRKPDPNRDTPPVLVTLAKVALVVTAIVVVTAIIVAIVFSGGAPLAAGSGAVAALGSGSAAETIGTVGAGVAVGIQAYGSTVKLKDFEKTSTAAA
jgi:type IV secretory pathway TrbL component